MKSNVLAVAMTCILLLGSTTSATASNESSIDPELFYKAGVLDLQRGNYEKAAQFLAAAAEYDHAGAIGLIGQMYLRGTPVTPKDPATARELLSFSAEAGNREAQYNLGFIYSKGIGLEKNLKIANSWYRQSANQGHASAQMSLAIAYLGGAGVEKNTELGCQWLEKSVNSKPELKKKVIELESDFSKLVAPCESVVATR